MMQVVMKCLRCGESTKIPAKRFCAQCQAAFDDINARAITALEKRYYDTPLAGSKFLQEELQKLHILWRKDPDRFEARLIKLNE